MQTKAEEEEIDRTPWGELEPSDEESSEEEEEDESDEEKPDETGFVTPADRLGAQGAGYWDPAWRGGGTGRWGRPCWAGGNIWRVVGQALASAVWAVGGVGAATVHPGLTTCLLPSPQRADHSGRVLVGASRHGDPRAH